MSSPTAITDSLPQAPDLAEVRRQVRSRLDAIEGEAMPALALRRAFLVRTWCTEDGDGVPVFTTSGEAISTHPAGVDRLASVLADQEGLFHEASALRELAAALDRYDAGGSSTLRAVGQGAPSGASAMPSDGVADGDPASSQRAYARWLLAYLLEVKREVRAARKRRDTLRLEDLHAEYTELRARVPRRVERKSPNGRAGADAAALSLSA